MNTSDVKQKKVKEPKKKNQKSEVVKLPADHEPEKITYKTRYNMSRMKKSEQKKEKKKEKIIKKKN